jgi:hypothetical protein
MDSNLESTRSFSCTCIEARAVCRSIVGNYRRVGGECNVIWSGGALSYFHLDCARPDECTIAELLGQ